MPTAFIATFATVCALLMAAGAGAADASVLLVCPQPGSASCPNGQYSSIQAAVNAAQPNDWVLVGPGDYHEKGPYNAGVWITQNGLRLRGMNRNGVVVDGTNPTSGTPCSSDPAVQDSNGGAGRNGIEVWKASGTYVENLTACNFLSGTAHGTGNQIWWNGGDGSGQIGMGAYWGNYLTATTTYFDANDPHQATYGIFTSNAGDPNVASSLNNDYAANMNDSAFYVGACQQQCNVVLDHVHAQNSSLGYSGTNAGGKLIIQNSEWDLNKSGIAPNTLNNDDAPPPQNGACPGTQTPCMTLQGNNVHDNNNPNVPGSGIASSAPVGTGIEISGGQFDIVRNNNVHDQGAWGIVVHDYPDTETPPATSHCEGGLPGGAGSQPGGGAPVCYFVAHGNQVFSNTLTHNGFFGNPTNGDLASQPAAPNPRNCFYGNTDAAGLTTAPPALETVDGQPCNLPGTGDSGPLTAQLVCDSGAFGACPMAQGVDSYPQPTTVHLVPRPSEPGMSNPCQGVPDNAWCSGGRPTGAAGSS